MTSWATVSFSKRALLHVITQLIWATTKNYISLSCYNFYFWKWRYLSLWKEQRIHCRVNSFIRSVPVNSDDTGIILVTEWERNFTGFAPTVCPLPSPGLYHRRPRRSLRITQPGCSWLSVCMRVVCVLPANSLCHCNTLGYLNKLFICFSSLR